MFFNYGVKQWLRPQTSDGLNNPDSCETPSARR
jgi:hypothetical protein